MFDGDTRINGNINIASLHWKIFIIIFSRVKKLEHKETGSPITNEVFLIFTSIVKHTGVYIVSPDWELASKGNAFASRVHSSWKGNWMVVTNVRAFINLPIDRWLLCIYRRFSHFDEPTYCCFEEPMRFFCCFSNCTLESHLQNTQIKV